MNSLILLTDIFFIALGQYLGYYYVYENTKTKKKNLTETENSIKNGDNK